MATGLDVDAELSFPPASSPNDSVANEHAESRSFSQVLREANNNRCLPCQTKHDIALVFRNDEEDVADSIKEEMKKLTYKGKPLNLDVRLFSDEAAFGSNTVVKPYIVSESCRIMFIVHTDNKNRNLESPDFASEEVIAEVRIIRGQDNVLPLHTKPGLQPPIGLASMSPMNWFQEGKRSETLLRIIDHQRKKRGETELLQRLEKLQLSGEERYKMTANPRGHCYIFSNKEFKSKPKRIGTENDRDGLSDLFRKLKFEVSVFDNKEADEIWKNVEELSKESHSQYDCVVLVFLTHGSEGIIYGSDDDSVNIEHMTALFKGDKCPSLAHKPKLFFFTSCRGTKFPIGVETDDGETDREFGQEVIKLVAPEAHFFIGYATVKGKKALRNVEMGSWYIHALLKVFNRDAASKDFASMMTDVQRELHDRECETPEGEFYKQAADSSDRLHKKLYF